MNIDKIKEYLTNPINNILYFEQINSTNVYAHQIAPTLEENTLIVANKQTNGIGRKNRVFVSDISDAIYMSLILKEQSQSLDTNQITMLIGVCVVEVFKDLYKINLSIKWVNDIFFKDKKVCGILAQSIFNTNNQIDSIIIGLGINLFDKDNHLPIEATSIFKDDSSFNKELIIASIWNKFFYYYNNHIDIVDKYKEKNFLINQEVEFEYKNQLMKGIATDIDNSGSLIVKTDNETITLLAGDVSISKESLKKIFEDMTIK